MFNIKTKGDLKDTYFEIPHLFSYLSPSKFNNGVVKSFQSLNIFVDKINGENLYLEIFVLSFNWKILNSLFEALNPQSPVFFEIESALVADMILLFDAYKYFCGILKFVIHFYRVLKSVKID